MNNIFKVTSLEELEELIRRVKSLSWSMPHIVRNR